MRGLLLAAFLLAPAAAGAADTADSPQPKEYLPVPMSTPYAPPVIVVPPELFRTSLVASLDEERRLRRVASLGVLEGLLAGAGSAAFIGGYIGHDLGAWQYVAGGLLAVWGVLCIPEWFERDARRQRVSALAASIKEDWDTQNLGASPYAEEGQRLRTELAWARDELPSSSIAASRKDSLTYYAIVGICSGLAIYGFMQGGESGRLVGMISLAGALGGGWMGIQNDIDIRANKRKLDAALAGWNSAFESLR